MAGFFKKVAGAFVEFEDEESETGNDQSKISLDDLTEDSAELLAQLEGHSKSELSMEIPISKDEDAPHGEEPVAPHIATANKAAKMTADEVFRKRGLVDGPNSAQRLLKIIGGLRMFPQEQQLTMVRAMDAADDSWSETEVLADARIRQEALREHLEVITRECEASTRTLQAELEQTRINGEAILKEIDKQIAQLYARREKEAAETTAAITRLESTQREFEREDAKARQQIVNVINAFSTLIAFFGGGQSKMSDGNH